MLYQILINLFCMTGASSSVAEFPTYEAAETAVKQIEASSSPERKLWAVQLYNKA